MYKIYSIDTVHVTYVFNGISARSLSKKCPDPALSWTMGNAVEEMHVKFTTRVTTGKGHGPRPIFDEGEVLPHEVGVSPKRQNEPKSTIECDKRNTCFAFLKRKLFIRCANTKQKKRSNRVLQRSAKGFQTVVSTRTTRSITRYASLLRSLRM